jgi:hypothetical protein
MFVWTPELAAQTPPFRGDGVALKVKPVDGKKLLAPVPTSLAPQRAPEYRPRASIVELVTTGTGSVADEADALVLLGSTGMKGPFKGQITMVSEADCTKVTNAGVDRWVQIYGAAGAVDIFALLGAWRPYAEMTGHVQTMRLALRRLRIHLAHAADYDTALVRAQHHAANLDTAMPQYRHASGYHGADQILAYLFPDHRPFFTAALANAKARDWPPNYLLACVQTLGDHAELATAKDFAWGPSALVIARSLREAGLPILLARVDANPSDSVALALTAYVSPEAAMGLAELLAIKEAHPTIAAYFAAHPELRDALTPHTRSKTKLVSAAAAKLLA